MIETLCYGGGVFLFVCVSYPYECDMDLCYEWCFVWLAGWLSVLCGKNFNVRCYMQTFHPNLFIPTMLVGTIDFYHCIPLSLTLTWPRGHKVSTNQNLGFIFFAHFSLIRMKFDVVMKQFKLNILRLLSNDWLKIYFSSNYLTKISIHLNGVWCTVETCWCTEPHTHTHSCPFHIQVQLI